MKKQIYVYDKLFFINEDDEEIDEIDEIDETDEINDDDADNILKTTPISKTDYLCEERDVDFEMTEVLIEKEETEGMNIVAAPTCATGLTPNCGECCSIFTNSAKRAAFGYQLGSAACECHDICVEDVRDICVKRRTLRHCIPCNPDGRAGCRGGFLPEAPPAVQSWRVLCAEERLSPATGCDRIINELEFEVVLRYASNTLAVVTPKDIFDCFWYEFARFPSGVFYPNNQGGLNQFRNELAVIDGSCKVIIIENVRVVSEGNDCILEILYQVIDKLWKHENLLVSAIKPYASNAEVENITVKQEFEQGHKISSCEGSGLCSGL